MDEAPRRPSRPVAATVAMWVVAWALLLTGTFLMTIVASTVPGPWTSVVFVAGVGLNGTGILVGRRARRVGSTTREDSRA